MHRNAGGKGWESGLGAADLGAGVWDLGFGDTGSGLGRAMGYQPSPYHRSYRQLTTEN